MNREIKFRGKRIDNGEWVYGDYTDNRFDEPSIWEDGYRIEIDHKTVGQYTGLKDKNGIEIYEGDIIQGGSIIKFGELTCANRSHSMCFYDEIYLGNKSNRHRYQDHLNPIRAYKMIVIGNIHDNKGD